MDYLIRDFQEGDVSALVLLCGRHAVYEQTDYQPKGKEEKLVRALLSTEAPLHGLIVTAGDEVIGYATYTFDFSTWDAQYFLYLDCLYIEEAYRGYGIGEAIMKRVIGFAKEKGCVNVQWQTPVFNEKAIRFYKRMGGISKEKQRFSIDVP